jgi:hypothetical protein
MKRIIIPMLAGGFILSVGSCSKSGSQDMQSASATRAKSAAPVQGPLTSAAAALLTPGDGSALSSEEMISFKWAANPAAYYSQLQISATPSFAKLIYDFYVEGTTYPANYFNDAGTRYWRVRYVDALGNAGPWSQPRSFVVKSQ